MCALSIAIISSTAHCASRGFSTIELLLVCINNAGISCTAWRATYVDLILR